jgi:hypothetical protein
MTPLLETARQKEIERLSLSLRAGGGVVAVHALQAQEAIDVASHVLSRLPDGYVAGALDVGQCATSAEFVVAFARAVAATLVGTHATGAFADRSWIRERDERLYWLADRTSDRFYQAVRFGETSGVPGDQDLFADAVDVFTRRASDQPTIVAVFGADELAEPRARRRPRLDNIGHLLWTLRSRLQHSIGPAYLALVGGTGVIDLIAEKDAAFYGWGTEIELAPLPHDVLAQMLYRTMLEGTGEGLSRDWPYPDSAATLAADLAAVCDGSVRVAEQLLDVLPTAHRAYARSEPSAAQLRLAQRAMDVLVELNATAIRTQARLLKDLHSNALPIARALARGDAPYAGVRHPSDASRPLRLLHDAGLAVQREARQWTLTDPVLAAWLRRPAAGFDAEEVWAAGTALR